MINFDNVTKEETEKHNPNWPQVPDHPYRILLIGGCGSRKTNLLFNIISQQPSKAYQVSIQSKIPFFN